MEAIGAPYLQNDSEIIKNCLDGDIESYNQLVKKYYPLLLRTAYRFLGNWDDAKDAVQDAFVKSFLALKTFQIHKCFSSWIYRILINTCKDILKSPAHKKRTQILQDQLDSQAHSFSDRIGEKEFLHKAIKKLPLKRRLAIILVELNELSSSEAAEILGCSESTVRVAVMKGKEQLRKIVFYLNEK